MKERFTDFVMEEEFDKNLLMEEYSINEIINLVNSKRMYMRFEEFFYRMGNIKKEEAYGRTPSKINMLPKESYSVCQEVDSNNDYVTYYVRMGDALAEYGPHRYDISECEEHPDHLYLIEVSHEEWNTEGYGLFPQLYEGANHTMPTLHIGYDIVDLTERRLSRRLKKKGLKIED